MDKNMPPQALPSPMVELQHETIRARRHTYHTIWYNKQLHGIQRSTIKESIVRIQEPQKMDQTRVCCLTWDIQKTELFSQWWSGWSKTNKIILIIWGSCKLDLVDFWRDKQKLYVLILNGKIWALCIAYESEERQTQGWRKEQCNRKPYEKRVNWFIET